MDEHILNRLKGDLIAVLCLIIGMFIGGYIESHANRLRFEKIAIEHNAGQYNPTTGKFEWLELVKEDR